MDAREVFTLAEASGRLPLVGHVVRIGRDPLGFFRSLGALGDVVVFGLGRHKAYLLTHPDLIRRMLVTDGRRFDRGVQFEKARPFVGVGLVTASEPLHMKRRRLVQPLFHRTRVANYVLAMREIAEDRITSWRSGEEVRLDREFHEMTIRIVSRALFSTDADGRFATEILQSLPQFLSGLTKRMLLPTSFLEKLPTPANRSFDTARRRMRDALSEVITRYRHDDADHGDLLSMLRDARDEQTGEALTDQEILDEAMTMLIAGTETAASALSWTGHLLSTRPEIQQRIADEAAQVLAGRPARSDDVPKLDFTRRVITEAMRLYPPVWLLSRRAVEDVDLGGHRIPAGSNVFFSAYALHRDPDRYPDPDRFDPDRWLPGGVRPASRTAYLPFSAGARNCAGEGFAWTEMVLIMSILLSRWSLHPVAGSAVRAVAVGTLHPDRVPVRIHERSR